MLSYIEGSVPARFQRFSNDQVRAAARLLRGLHHAIRGCLLAAGRPVVCHHDAGPNNTVFRDGLPVALIDFDTAAPGEPLEDLAYTAWTWCLSSKPSRGGPTEQAAQARTLLDAYDAGDNERHGLIPAILARQTQNIAYWQAFTGPTATREQINERVEWSRR